MAGLKTVWKRFAGGVDWWDMVFVIGVAVFAYGLLAIYKPSALLFVGMVAMALGLKGASRR